MDIGDYIICPGCGWTGSRDELILGDCPRCGYDEQCKRIEGLEKDTANNLEAIAEHAERIIELERQVANLKRRVRP